MAIGISVNSPTPGPPNDSAALEMRVVSNLLQTMIALMAPPNAGSYDDLRIVRTDQLQPGN